MNTTQALRVLLMVVVSSMLVTGAWAGAGPEATTGLSGTALAPVLQPNAAGGGPPAVPIAGLPCPSGTLYGQPPHGPSDDWNVATSDEWAGVWARESFVISELPAESICDLHWWGWHALMQELSGEWVQCEENPTEFAITIGNSSGEDCTYTVTVDGTPTGMIYQDGGNEFELWEYHVNLEPCCSSVEGTMDIAGTGPSNDCVFRWLSSAEGDGLYFGFSEHEGWIGPPDLSFCLTKQSLGACCLAAELTDTPWCRVLSEAECLAAEGTYIGADTDCGHPLGRPNYYESWPDLEISPLPTGVSAINYIMVEESCEIGDLDVDVCIHHPRIGDLVIKLEHLGVEVTLWDGACDGQEGLGVVFDDEGYPLVCATPALGTVNPASACGGRLGRSVGLEINGPLARFDGLEVAGPYVLSIYDLGLPDDEGGVLTHWSLHIDFLEDNPCVEPRGACCLVDGACEVRTQAECEEDYASAYLGDLTTCATGVCPCAVECPPDGVPEEEPDCYDGYVDHYNGGCSVSPPVFLPIDLDVPLCGRSGTYLNQWGMPVRENDWMEVTITEEMVLMWAVEAEFSVHIAIFRPGETTPCDFEVLAEAYGDACEIVRAVAYVTPGTYWLFVGPTRLQGVPCGVSYVAVCQESGACCLRSDCVDLPEEACAAVGGWDWQAGTICDGGPWPACLIMHKVTGACCLEHASGTPWCQMEAHADCERLGGLFLGYLLDCGEADDSVQVRTASPFIGIPESPGSAITHTIVIDESCEVGDVDIDVVLHHPALSDLVITVEHYGVEVTLWDHNCTGEQHLAAIFDDEGGDVLCTTPVVGHIKPTPYPTFPQTSTPLSAFDGMEFSGAWTIRVADMNENGMVGVLTHWSVHVRFLVDNPCVAPRGACCLEDGVCEVLTEAECSATEFGEYRGDFTTCVPNPCPAPPPLGNASRGDRSAQDDRARPVNSQRATSR